MLTLYGYMLFENNFCCSDTIHSTNQNDFTPRKKVGWNDFEMHFAKCERYETEQKNGEIKIF